MKSSKIIGMCLGVSLTLSGVAIGQSHQYANNMHLEQKILAPDGVADDRFGAPISLGRVWIAVAALGAEVSGHPDAGAVYVYKQTGTTWHFHSKLVSPAPEPDGQFGAGLDFSIFTTPLGIAIGAPNEDAAGVDSGAVYVFRYDPMLDTWGMYSTPLPNDVSAGDHYGQSISIAQDGLSLAVGAVGDDFAGIDAGSVYVMTVGGGLVTRYLGSDTEAGDRFGAAVDLRASYHLLVGAPSEDSLGMDAGAAYLWKNGSTLLVGGHGSSETDKLLAFDGGSDHRFGVSVASGTYGAIIGADGHDQWGPNSGAVYVYDIDPNWIDPSSVRKRFAQHPGPNDHFGNRVAMGLQARWIASNSRSSECVNQGGSAEHGYGINHPSQQTICAPGATASDHFSSGVSALSVSGRPRLAGGTPNDDDLGIDSGSVSIYVSYGDCNNNGVHDHVDLFNNTSQDCNSNGIPDECEIFDDCNGNQIVDSCEWGADPTLDCNWNGLLDACEISQGSTPDVNNNGVPDECDAGFEYCSPAALNSTGMFGKIGSSGSLAVNQNTFALTLTDLPANQFGYFLTGLDHALVIGPGGSSGNLCLGGTLGRFNRPGEVWSSDSLGEVTMALDLTNIPLPGVLSAGSTRYFQAWHRDNTQTSTDSNFSTALSVIFQ